MEAACICSLVSLSLVWNGNSRQRRWLEVSWFFLLLVPMSAAGSPSKHTCSYSILHFSLPSSEFSWFGFSFLLGSEQD